MAFTRRDMIKLGLLGGASMLVPAGFLAEALHANAVPESPVFPPFQMPLPIPGNHQAYARDPTTDFYRVTMQPAIAQILPDLRLRTPMWTYNGSYPGPTFQVQQGRRMQVIQTNRLQVPTSVHLHGAVVDGNSDGHPLDVIAPNGAKTYAYPNTEHEDPDRQSARTQWYHDHAIDITGENVYRGLCGFYLIHDALEAKLNLPSGRYDIPLVIQDLRFNADGSLFFPRFPDFNSRNGDFGDTIVVNGAMQPFLKVEPRKYRFRILNGSQARQYNLALSTGQPLVQIATEGGFLSKPVEHASLVIAEAERYEFIVDFSHYKLGTQVVLQNLEGQSSKDSGGGNSTDVLMRFDVDLPLAGTDTSTIPSTIARTTPTPRASDLARLATVTRKFRFERSGGQWVVNRLPFDKTLRRVDASPKSGDVEIWEVENGSGGWTHPIHIHLVNFLVLDRNGGPPRPGEFGWKETVFLDTNESARVVMKWPDVPADFAPSRTDGRDFHTKYVFHCHNLEHEDHMMMGEIEVQPQGLPPAK